MKKALILATLLIMAGCVGMPVAPPQDDVDMAERTAIGVGLVKITETDGTPSGWVKQVTVSNGSLAISGSDATLTTGGSGQAVTLDIGDDAGNDSVDLGEIATTGDTNSIVTEPSADKMLIDMGNNWPTADTANAGDSATAFFSAGTIEHEYGGLEDDVSAYSGLVKIATGATSAVTVTTFGESLLDDANAAAGRTTLEVTATADDIIQTSSWTGGDLTGTGLAPQVNETGVDHDLLANFVAAEHYRWDNDISGTATVNVANLGTTLADISDDTVDANLDFVGDIIFTEKADHSSTPGAGKGYLWVKSTTPSTLIFTDDAGSDTTLGAGGGSGDITAVGPGYSTGAAFTDGVVSTGTTMFVWEGTGDDTNELSIISPSANPGADIDITLPAATGTLVTSAEVLTLTNTDAFTPSADYHPSTKKYVDDNIAAGAVVSVGDSSSAAALDGTSDGGTQILFYDAQGATTFAGGDTSGAITLTLPAVATGTLYATGNTDVALADGGTGQSLADPGAADYIMFWDDSDSAVEWLGLGNGLTITTNTIAASVYTVDVNELTNTSGSIGLADTATARAAIGLEIGVDVQAYNDDLDALAAPTAWRMFYSDAADPFIQEITLGADGTFLESNGASAAPAFRALLAGDIPDISATYEAVDAEIVRADTADTIGADWEWQDGIAMSFGNDNDWEAAYDETTDDRLEFTHTAGAGADVLWDLNDNAADSTYTITNSDATYEANVVVEGDITYSGELIYGGSGDQYLQMAPIAAWTPSGDPAIAFEGGSSPYSLKFWDGTTENSIMTSASDITWTSTTQDFSSVTNLVLPTAAADASGEISLSTGNQLTWHDGTKVVKIDTTVTTDNYVLKYDTASATFNLEADADSGGAPAWSAVTAPTADTTITHDAGEETTFTYTGAFTTGAQFLVSQATGDPTGGVLFEARASDSNVTVMEVGDGTNVWTVSTAGRFSNSGTADINLAADTDLLIGGAQIDYDDMAGSANAVTTGSMTALNFIPTGGAALAGEIGYNTNAFSWYANSENMLATAGTDLWTFSSGTAAEFAFTPKVYFGVGIDGVGAVDLDYGSADITDHTFVADGGTVVIDGTVTPGAAAATDGAIGYTGGAYSLYGGTDTFTITNSVNEWQFNSTGDVFSFLDNVLIGGTAQLRIPTAADPTTDALGSIALDSDDNFIEFYGDGVASRVVGGLYSETFSIVEPDTIQGITDDVVLKHFMADSYPHGVTIKDIAISSASAYTSEVFLIEEWSNRAGAAQTTVESITISSQYQEDDGTLSDSAIAADAFLVVNLDDTPEDIAMVEITVTYYINPGN